MAGSVAQRSQGLAQASVLMSEHFMAEDKRRVYGRLPEFGDTLRGVKTAKVVWTNRDLTIQHENGPGSTPVVWGDLMIFHLDGSDVQYIAALNKHTGELAWKTPRSGELNENSRGDGSGKTAPQPLCCHR